MQKSTQNKAIRTGRDIQPEISDLALDILSSKLNDLISYREKRKNTLQKDGQVDIPLEKIWQRYENWTCKNMPASYSSELKIKSQHTDFQKQQEVIILTSLQSVSIDQNIKSFIAEVSKLFAKKKPIILSDVHSYQEATWWFELFDLSAISDPESRISENIGLMIDNPFTVLELDEILFELKKYVTNIYFDQKKYEENTKELLSRNEIPEKHFDLIRERLLKHAQLRQVELFLNTKNGGFEKLRKNQEQESEVIHIEDIALSSEEVFLVNDQF